MVVAIDGPAGSGKSTAARNVAAALGFHHLDTGAMYRAVALLTIDDGIDPVGAAATAVIEPGPPFRVNGSEPGERLRTAEVTERASQVAADPDVRAALVERQQAILADGDWVAEGRDICEVVAPDAAVKVWLTASEAERARRRAVESGRSEQDVLAAQRSRDQADGGHGRATLEAPAGATVLDTTGLAPEEVTEAIVRLARAASG
jgi:cytidylate kinase